MTKPLYSAAPAPSLYDAGTEALDLADKWEKLGVIVTIERHPHTPLAMGNHSARVKTWRKRGYEPAPAVEHAPQAECAPRAQMINAIAKTSYGSGMIDAIEDFVPVPRADAEKDAARYRWLRQQHWNEADMAVVCDPKKSVKLGFDCPSGERLDDAIDAAILAANKGERRA
jgi:hypothetical protein